MVASHQQICRHRVCWRGAFATKPHMNKLTHFHRWDWVGRHRHFWSVSAEGRIWKLKIESWVSSSKNCLVMFKAAAIILLKRDAESWFLSPVPCDFRVDGKEVATTIDFGPVWSVLQGNASFATVEQWKTKFHNETVPIISAYNIACTISTGWYWYKDIDDIKATLRSANKRNTSLHSSAAKSIAATARSGWRVHFHGGAARRDVWDFQNLESI